MNEYGKKGVSETARTYELSFLLSSEEALKEVKEVLSREHAEITHENPLTSLRLAYPIKKQTSAFFGYVHFSGEPGTIATIERGVRVKLGVLRALIIVPSSASSSRVSRSLRTTEPTKPVSPPAELTNEVLEQKLEEILK